MIHICEYCKILPGLTQGILYEYNVVKILLDSSMFIQYKYIQQIVPWKYLFKDY